MEYELALAGLTLVGLSLLGMAESAHGCLSDVALRSMAAENQGSRRRRFLRHLLAHRLQFWLSLSFGIQAMTILLAMLLFSIGSRLSVPYAPALSLLAALALAGTFRQIVPRLIVQNNPAKFLLALLPAFQIYFNLARFFVTPTHRLIVSLRREPEQSLTPESILNASDDTIQALLDVGAEEGILAQDEGELIQSVIEFSDTVVKEIMTQRSEVVSVEASASVRQVCDIMIKERHSRLPVYKNDSDNVVGVVYIRDLLVCWSQGAPDQSVGDVARPAYFVPENKSIADLLEDMQKSKTQIALVIDEYGGIAGLVTIEDILEEIVGEIEDEDDPDSDDTDIVAEGESVYVIRGNAEIRKIETLLGIELESDDFLTVNGFITNRLGRVPHANERITLHGLEIEILEADERVIRRIRLRAPEPATDAAAENESANKA
jgi:CBS domain containing-hemolysin-like protein